MADPTRLVSGREFASAARDGDPSGLAVYRVAIGDPEPLDDISRKIRFCFSDGRVDLVGDTIDPNGWDLADFNRNPVALWSHDSFSPPIGRASNLAVEGERLMGDIEFMPADISPFADTIYRMVRAKYIRACSVGFLPTDWKFSDDDERRFGIDFKKQRLLEISCCPLPANPGALAEARAKGIDTRPLVEWAEKVLDGGGKMILPRAEVEQLRKAAKEPLAMATKKPTRKDDGMREDDPASGGAAVATCGRSAEEECGMQDPEECSVHRTKDVDPDDEDTKRLRAMLRSVVRAELKRLKKAEGDPDHDGDVDEPDHMVEMKRAQFHTKMAKVCRDAADEHHDETDKCIRRAIKAYEDGEQVKDDPPVQDDPAKPTEPDGDEAKAKARAKVRELMAAN